jgi:hypothetical protein
VEIEVTGRRRFLGHVEWAVAVRPCPGEGVSGDRHAVVPSGSGVLVAVIDALGHGKAAESTARRASRILERHADEPLPAVVRRCHDALRGDRGVVMSVAAIDGARGTMAWVGVGNVSALLLRSVDGAPTRRERLVQAAGIVGAQLPELRVVGVTLSPGDVLLLATDGIREGFGEDLAPQGGDLQRLADRVVIDHATRTDDALVLVARYLGRA